MSILDALYDQILRDIERKERDRIAANIDKRLSLTVMSPVYEVPSMTQGEQ